MEESALSHGGGQVMDEMDRLARNQFKKWLGKDLMKLNYLVATWPLFVFLGRNMTKRGAMRDLGLEKPEYLLLSALFGLRDFDADSLRREATATTGWEEW